MRKGGGRGKEVVGGRGSWDERGGGNWGEGGGNWGKEEGGKCPTGLRAIRTVNFGVFTDFRPHK